MTSLDIGQILGLVANLGVIAGIVFLAIEIRQSSSATQASSREAMSLATIDFLMQMASDEGKASFWRRALINPDTLNADQQFRRDMIAYAVAESWEMAYSQWQRGVLSTADWQKWGGAIAMYMAAPGFLEFWKVAAPNIRADFRAYAECLDREAIDGFRRGIS